MSEHNANASSSPSASAPQPAAPASAPKPAAPAKPAEDGPTGLHPYPNPDRREFLLKTRGWFAVGWASFSLGAAAAGGALQRFLFPNVLYEPPQVFKAGFPADFAPDKVEERFKEKYACWIVFTSNDPATGKSGFYALTTVCTHLGCTPNWLQSESKFKCPCHGSGFNTAGVNFEGPAPRPLERFRIALADDGQLLVDKTVKYQHEKGDWDKPDAFLSYRA